MSIMVGVGRGAQAGVLIKDAEALEQLEKVTAVVVDKTGTLTEGRPTLEQIVAVQGFDQAELLRLVAAVEASSEHPLAAAVRTYAAERTLSVSSAQDFYSDPGLGVWGRVEGKHVLVGNRRLLARNGVATAVLDELGASARDRGATVIFVAVDGQSAGIVVIADAIKDSAQAAIDALQKRKVRVVMLTGDNAKTAQAVGRQLGLDEVVADVLPQDKAEAVRRLQREGYVVAMAGDGVNDAPALAQADVGMAMGTGTDIAMEAAGVTLVSGDLRGLVRAIGLSRLTMRNIRQNLVFAFGYNAIGVPLAAGILYPFWGILLAPVFASLAMSLSSVSVIGNALRLRAARLD
jgi:Cu+-exporting ATPase